MKLSYNDERHAYWLDGKRCKSVTTLAKIPDDTYSLDMWRRRQTAIGLAKAPHLLESVAAHHTDRNKLNELCEQAMDVAGASQAAERGTAAHRVTERIDQGEDVILTPTAVLVADTWKRLLDGAGLDVVPDMVERCIVYPERRVCGKLDRVLRVRDDSPLPKSLRGKLVIGDLKTGAGAIKYPRSTAIQLALYANAPLLARPWEGLDGETTEFDPLPDDLDRTTGIVVSMPAEGVAQVYAIDLTTAQDVIEEIIWPTLEWRKYGPDELIVPVGATVSLDPVEDERKRVLEIVNALSDDAKKELRREWPYTGLSLKKRDGWSMESLAHVFDLARTLRDFPGAEVVASNERFICEECGSPDVFEIAFDGEGLVGECVLCDRRSIPVRMVRDR